MCALTGIVVMIPSAEILIIQSSDEAILACVEASCNTEVTHTQASELGPGSPPRSF